MYLFPKSEEYRLYYSQSLYHACLYNEAMDATCQIEDPEFQGKVIEHSLQAYWKLINFLITLFLLHYIYHSQIDIETTSCNKVWRR